MNFVMLSSVGSLMSYVEEKQVDIRPCWNLLDYEGTGLNVISLE